VAGFFAFKFGAVFLQYIKLKPEPITLTLLGVGTGVAVFLLLRKIGHSLIGVSSDVGTSGGRVVAGPVGTILGLIPLALVLAVGVTALRTFATLAELRHTDQSVAEFTRVHAPHDPKDPPPAPPDYPRASPFVSFRDTIESIPHVCDYLDRIDPINPPARRHLANLILISKNTELFARLADSRRIYTLFTLPELENTLRDTEVLRLRNESKYIGLLRNPLLVQAATLPSAEIELQQVDLPLILPKILQPPS
jgi:hypothetical protein